MSLPGYACPCNRGGGDQRLQHEMRHCVEIQGTEMSSQTPVSSYPFTLLGPQEGSTVAKSRKDPLFENGIVQPANSQLQVLLEHVMYTLPK